MAVKKRVQSDKQRAALQKGLHRQVQNRWEQRVREACRAHDFAKVEALFNWWGYYLETEPEALEATATA